MATLSLFFATKRSPPPAVKGKRNLKGVVEKGKEGDGRLFHRRSNTKTNRFCIHLILIRVSADLPFKKRRRRGVV